MNFKNKYIVLSFTLSLACCRFFPTDNINLKPQKILDKANSIILDLNNNKKDQLPAIINSALPQINSITPNIDTATAKNILDSNTILQPILPDNKQDNLLKPIEIKNSDTTSHNNEQKQEISEQSTENTIQNTNSSITIQTIANTNSTTTPTNITEKTSTTKTDTKEDTPSLDTPTTYDNEKHILQQNSNAIQHPTNILRGNNSGTYLKGLNSESNNIQYTYTYNSHYYSKPTSISGSYFDSSIKTIEQNEFEFEENDDKYSKLETRLNNKYNFKLKNTINNVEQAIKLAEQIKDDLEIIAFNRIKLSNQGKMATESEKQQAKEKLSKFTKNKLESDLKNLLNTIEKTFNNANDLTNIPDYPSTFQTEQQAKSKLNELTSEINSLIIKMQKNNLNNHQVYPTLYYNYIDYYKYQALFAKLQLVKNLLTRTGIVAR